MRPWVLASVVGACGSVPHRPAATPAPVARCVGEGERARGPFAAPHEYLLREVNDALDPVFDLRARDPDLAEELSRTAWTYDELGRPVQVRFSTDADPAYEWTEDTTWYDDESWTWERWDARGALRAFEVHLQAPRSGRPLRTLRDLDGDLVIDEIDAFRWDDDDRLIQRDTWAPDGPTPIARTVNDYLAPGPRLDRLERVDTDGDNAFDHATWYAYDDLGRLLQTHALDGTITEYRFDDDGRPVAVLEVGPTHRRTWEAAWTALGLPAWTREDLDHDGDGVVDEQDLTSWRWTCDAEVLPDG